MRFRITESVSGVDTARLRQDALEWLANGATKEYTGRGFILPDGSVVDNSLIYNYGERTGWEANHGMVDRKLCAYLADKYGVSKEDVYRAAGVESCEGSSPIIDSLNCVIRVNGGAETYVAVPDKGITSAQKRSLEEWIDSFVSRKPKSGLIVSTLRYDWELFHAPFTGKDIVDAISRYYTSGTLTESISVEDYDNIINDAKAWLERGKVEGLSPRGFILANGDLVDNQKLYPDSPYNTPPHDVVSRHMIDYLAKKYDVPFDEMADFFIDPDEKEWTNYALLPPTAIDFLGAIRVNGSNENYICIPQHPISSAQARTLEEWIDAFVSKFPQAYLYVTTQDGNNGGSFFPDKGIIGRDVVRAIRRYYTSGVLTEDKEKDHK